MKKLFFILLTAISPCFGEGITEGNNQFVLDVYAKLVSGGNENIIFSPYSIFSNLSMVYTGAKDKTAEEIAAVLHVTMPPDLLARLNHQWIERLITPNKKTGYQLQVANGLFVNKGVEILKPFTKMATSDFNASVASIDFSAPDKATDTLNAWFSNQTEGKISSLLQKGDLDALTKLVIASAIYFHGNWVQPFDPKETRDDVFHLSENQTVTVPMMHQTAVFPYFENALAQGLWLPLRLGTRAEASPSFVILVPREYDLLDNLEGSFDSDAVSHWMQAAEQTLIQVQMPKFCFSEKIQLASILQQLGMKVPFTTQANFSGINGQKDLYLSKVIHASFIGVDENGVTATAGTASSIGMKSTGPNKKEPTIVDANRPFLFFIVDQETESILFMGKLTNPDVARCP